MTKHRGKRTGKYRSKFEASIGPSLEGWGFAYEGTRVAYARDPGTYIPDFVRGSVWVEAKGYFAPADRKKLLQVKADYPHKKIILVFQNPRVTISRTSKTTYAHWATAHGFPWCSAADIDIALQ